MKRKILAITLVLALLFSVTCVAATATEISANTAPRGGIQNGSCGDGLKYNYNSNTGVLIITYTGTGTGVMKDYDANNYSAQPVTNTPWKFAVNELVIGEGVTSIGKGAFFNTSISEVKIPSTVTSIGDNAFNLCSNLETLALPLSVSTLGDYCYSYSTIKNVYMFNPDLAIGIQQDGDYTVHGVEGSTAQTFANENPSVSFALLSPHTITYNANGGAFADAPEDQVKQPGTELTLTNNVPIRQGHLFIGWSLDSDATVPSYESGATFSEEISQDVTMYAIWNSPHSITYNANGGAFVDAPEDQVKQPGTELTLTNNVPIRQGYSFKGWSLNPFAAVPSYGSGATFSEEILQDVTMYAIWDSFKTITYNANGGTFANVPEVQQTEPGISYTLTNEVPTREGYTFMGWSKNRAALSATYRSGATLSEELQQDITLYAIYSKNSSTATDTLVVYPIIDNSEDDRWDDTFVYLAEYIASLKGGSCTYLYSTNATKERVLDEMFSGRYAAIFFVTHGTNYALDLGCDINNNHLYLTRTDIVNYKNMHPNLSLNNALVLSDACSFMYRYTQSYSLAQALIDAGAGFVAGDQNTTYFQWNIYFDFVKCLTGAYDGIVHTAVEAFNIALSNYYSTVTCTNVTTTAYLGNPNWKISDNMAPDTNGAVIDGFTENCGTNSKYSFEKSDGKTTLRISPVNAAQTASLPEYILTVYAGWNFAKDQISDIIIEDGITNVGSSSFASDHQSQCAVQRVVLGKDVTSIGRFAFSNCANLSGIVLPEGLKRIDNSAFYKCENIDTLTIPSSVNYISDFALYKSAETITVLSKRSNDTFDGEYALGGSSDHHVTIYGFNGSTAESYANSSSYYTFYPLLDTHTNAIVDSVSTERFTSLNQIAMPKKDGYIFTGWFTAPEGGSAVTDSSILADSSTITDIYAHWTPIGTVAKVAEDTRTLPGNAGTYKGFDLVGTQIRTADYKPGLRFITSLSNELIASLGGNVEYGYIAGKQASITADELVEGVANSIKIVCSGSENNFFSTANYRIYSMVINYSEESQKSVDLIARSYIKYTDANGISRTLYNDYTGTNVKGGCCTNYNAIKSAIGQTDGPVNK